MHFTTNHGLLGVLYSSALKSKARLAKDKQLEFILKPNAPVRKDPDWLDFVNLSLSSINDIYFEISANKWHRGEDIWWCVLAFDPEIISHSGVYFTTTNNIYTGVIRTMSESGLERMFAPVVTRWVGNDVKRPVGLPASHPTCEQAEVLYPGEVSTKYLRRVYVRTHEEGDEVSAQIAATGHQEIEIVVSPKTFRRHSAR